jgi:5-methylcytosine-specific restriction endonuclease McrBC GTP-binding regulatory subunit McrB
MRYYLGKFSNNYFNQLDNKFYECDNINKLNGIQLGDYVFIYPYPKGDSTETIRLWQVKEIVTDKSRLELQSDTVKVLFEEIINATFQNIDFLIACKYFDLNKDLVVNSHMSTKVAFLPLIIDSQFDAQNFFNIEFYNQDSLRKVKICKENALTNDRYNFQLYIANGVLKCKEPEFGNMPGEFKDNRNFKGKGSPIKDRAFDTIEKHIQNSKEFNLVEFSIYTFYFCFFCDYVEKDDSINQNLINAIYGIGEEKANKLYSIIDKIKRFLDIDSRTNKVVFGYRETENLFSVTIGQRYCFSMKYKNEEWLWGYISTEKLDQWYQNYDGLPQVYYNYSNDINDLENNMQDTLKSSKIEFNRVLTKSGYTKHNHKDFRKSVFDLDFRNDLFTIAFNNEKSTKMSETKMTDFPLNQILYGAPGTGKTYATKKLAIEIIDDKIYENRAEINRRYEELINSNQIQFVTFHQSMSYEDFIEGIKPITNENQVTYEVVDGLFKKISYLASQEPINYGDSENTAIVPFEDAWDFLTQQVISLNDSKFTLKSLTGTEIEIIEISNQGNLILKPKVENGLEYTISFNRTKKLFDVFPNLESISNIDKEFRSVIGGSYSTGYWAVVNFLNNWRNDNLKNSGSKSKYQSTKKFVLIIDEINRGNVSSIFGELITLIEEDKRKGILIQREETIEVILPYSKDRLSVPDNLYIIGTMNTADRSVEALDTALRRRFSFVEMPPISNTLTPYECLRRFWIKNIGNYGGSKESYIQYESEIGNLLGLNISDYSKYVTYGDNENNTFAANEFVENLKSIVLFDGINLEKLLNSINSRIELLIDKNHQIGHAYFINLESFNDLVFVFKNKIIPLLEEYFYGDYGKIGLVLGSEFIKESSQSTIFAKFDYEDAELLKEKKVWVFTNSSFWTVSSFQSIYA